MDEEEYFLGIKEGVFEEDDNDFDTQGKAVFDDLLNGLEESSQDTQVVVSHADYSRVADNMTSGILNRWEKILRNSYEKFVSDAQLMFIDDPDLQIPEPKRIYILENAKSIPQNILEHLNSKVIVIVLWYISNTEKNDIKKSSVNKFLNSLPKKTIFPQDFLRYLIFINKHINK